MNSLIFFLTATAVLTVTLYVTRPLVIIYTAYLCEYPWLTSAWAAGLVSAALSLYLFS